MNTASGPPRPPLDIDQALEVFDDFLMIMDDQMEALEADGERYGICLQPTMDNLEKLELLFFKMAEHATEDDLSRMFVYFARYVGEIVRAEFKGRWHLALDDPRNVYYNTPVIIDHTPIAELEFSPISAMRALWLRKRHGLLRQIVMSDIQPRILDIDHLIEEEDEAGEREQELGTGQSDRPAP